MFLFGTLLRVSLTTMLGLVMLVADAQENACWIEGKVTFKNGETQYCVLNYDATVSEGLLQIKENQKILTYSVKEVESFSFFDDYAGYWRRFYAFPLYLVRGGVTRDFFMELVYHGAQWSILRKKERWVGSYTYQMLSPESYFVRRPVKKLKYARYYEICYLLDMKTGKIEELTRDLLLASTQDQQTAIKDYIKEHRLRFHTVEDFVYLLEYYHQLLSATEPSLEVTVSPSE